MNLKQLELISFRHFNDVKIEFGEKLTIISGQNGTGKSSVLGWVAQLCDYKGEEKQINLSSFKEDWGNVFRFCEEKDYPKKYSVKFSYELNSKIETKTLSTRFIESVGRYKCDFERNNKIKAVQKAVQHPVIYLGLKRLIPLATESKINVLSTDISSKSSNLFSKLSKEILLLKEKEINPETIKSPNKKILAMKTESYGHLGNSAGQDNIGQIISALLSFENLKDRQKGNYSGGIILIDEIDATLYAGSQLKLIQTLNTFATSLNLQIIFSTHSLEILDFISEEINKDTFIGKGAKINYLNQIDGKISNIVNPSIKWIKLNIKAERGKVDLPQKVNVICEDINAEKWIKNLIQGTELKSMINPCGAVLPDTTLAEMAVSPNIVFKNQKYVLDGDSRKRFATKAVPKNICFLPSDFGVEVVMYHFIYGLLESDKFWNEELNLTWQTCFKDYKNESNQNNAKAWFNDESIKKDFFGNGYSKLFNRWKEENKSQVDTFIDALRKIL
jgi:AAA15 family ATPase/GTPase